MRSLFLLLVALAALGTGCGDDAADAVEDPVARYFPDVIDATATPSGDGTWTISATLSSPYESADRYADAWRVRTSDGDVIAVRELLHDHTNEQPFTRSLSGVTIDAAIDSVIIEGRDQVSGWGGATFELPLDAGSR